MSGNFFGCSVPSRPSKLPSILESRILSIDIDLEWAAPILGTISLSIIAFGDILYVISSRIAAEAERISSCVVVAAQFILRLRVPIYNIRRVAKSECGARQGTCNIIVIVQSHHLDANPDPS